ncbi:hypothetical protein [Ruegeria sp. Alg231-54]|uniref:hypothetical protein n=1 Tax=Ruegeria sp. Alg231-54 TaxID=1922221 RepID=UPI000D562282|nr:hypothetical protein [Ruegeria sp. Alg231-54]
MTKASDQKARPEVAKKDANKVSDIYDFVQSPDWQEMLENARKQREINIAARKAKAAALQSSDPGQNKATNSTDGAQPANALNAAAGQSGAFGKPAQATSSHQSGESVQKATAGRFDSQTANDDSRATENVARDARGEASTVPPDGGLALGIHPDNRPEDLVDPKLGQELPGEGFSDRLRRTLKERTDDQNRKRLKMRLGLVAAGCGIGVVASSSVFLILSGLNAPGPTENAGLVSQETPATGAIMQQDAELAEHSVPPSDVTSGAADLAVTSATVFDTSSESNLPDGDTAASQDLASLSLLLSVSSEQSGGIKPELSRLAPSVRSFVPTLVQPPLPITLLSYRPRQELNLGFVRLQSTPEIFSTSVAVLETTVTVARPEEFLKGVNVAATPTTMRPPVVPIQPGVLDYTETQVSLDVLLTEPESGYQPEQGLQTSESTGSDIAVRPEGTSLAVEIAQPLPYEPQPEPVELAALPTAPKPIDAPAPLMTPAAYETSLALRAPVLSAIPSPLESPVLPLTPPLLNDAITPLEPEPAPANVSVAYRIYAPTNVPQSVVDSVVTNLTSTGHKLNGQARVGFKITQSNVRFYHKQDEERAAALARDSGALLRDFTGSNVKTPSGIVELWLAGKGSDVTRVKQTNTLSTARTQAPNRVNQLKSQVLSKLKKATTQ